MYTTHKGKTEGRYQREGGGGLLLLLKRLLVPPLCLLSRHGRAECSGRHVEHGLL